MTPLPHLDLFTVKAVTLVTVLVVSLMTLLAWRINRPVVGMGRFSVGLLGLCVGSVLGISRLLVSGNLIVIAGNVLIVAGMISVARGIREFRGFPTLPPIAVGVLAATTAGPFCYWLFVQDDFGKRVAIISGSMALLAMDAAMSMLRKTARADRLTCLPTGLALGLSTVFLAVRTVAAFTGHYGSNFLAPVPIEIPLSICADVSYVACAFGMILASNARMRDEAERMALFDPLTSLPNRRMLGDRLIEVERRAIETGWKVGLIYLDLDDFKLVNDTLGHEAGDRLLRRVSAAMTPMLSPGDCLARVGGDEFVVVVEDVSCRADLAALASRLTSAVESERIPGGSDRVRTSCGIALFPNDGDTAHEVMREADSNMYNAKRERRGVAQLPVAS